MSQNQNPPPPAPPSPPAEKKLYVAPGQSFITRAGLLTEGSEITAEHLKSKADPKGTAELKRQMDQGAITRKRPARAGDDAGGQD